MADVQMVGWGWRVIDRWKNGFFLGDGLVPQSVNVDQLELLGEREFDAVRQLHFVIFALPFNLGDVLSGIGVLDVCSDFLWDQRGGYFASFAIDFGPIAFLVEFQLGAILKNHIVVIVADARLT